MPRSESKSHTLILTTTLGEHRLSRLEPRHSTGEDNSLFQLTDSAGRHLNFIGAELNSLADGWLTWRRGRNPPLWRNPLLTLIRRCRSALGRADYDVAEPALQDAIHLAGDRRQLVPVEIFTALLNARAKYYRGLNERPGNKQTELFLEVRHFLFAARRLATK